MLGRLTIASTVEAVVGAVYYDSGHDTDAVSAVLATLGVYWC